MLASGIEDQGRALIDKESLKGQINTFEGNYPTSIVERPIGPVKVSFLTKLRNTGFAALKVLYR